MKTANGISNPIVEKAIQSIESLSGAPSGETLEFNYERIRNLFTQHKFAHLSRELVKTNTDADKRNELTAKLKESFPVQSVPYIDFVQHLDKLSPGDQDQASQENRGAQILICLDKLIESTPSLWSALLAHALAGRVSQTDMPGVDYILAANHPFHADMRGMEKILSALKEDKASSANFPELLGDPTLVKKIKDLAAGDSIVDYSSSTYSSDIIEPHEHLLPVLIKNLQNYLLRADVTQIERCTAARLLTTAHRHIAPTNESENNFVDFAKHLHKIETAPIDEQTGKSLAQLIVDPRFCVALLEHAILNGDNHHHKTNLEQIDKMLSTDEHRKRLMSRIKGLNLIKKIQDDSGLSNKFPALMKRDTRVISEPALDGPELDPNELY